MALRDVRLREWNNRLVFRYDSDLDVIEVRDRGRTVRIVLDDYRPAHKRRSTHLAGVDFERIDGVEVSD